MAQAITYAIVPGGAGDLSGSSWANAANNVATASTLCLANGEIRLGGDAWTDRGAATWTYNSAVVTMADTTGYVAEEFIYPYDAPSGERCPFQIATVDSGTNITLRAKWFGTTGSYNTVELVTQTWTPQTMTGGTTGQKITGGWNPATGLQDATMPTCPTGNVAILTISQANTLLEAGGFLGCGVYNAASHILLTFTASCRVTGTIRAAVGNNSTVMCNAASGVHELVDVVVACGTTGQRAIGSGGGAVSSILRANRVFVHAGRGMTGSASPVFSFYCNEILEFGSSGSTTQGAAGIFLVGRLQIRLGTNPPTAFGKATAIFCIRELDATDTAGNPIVPTGVGIEVHKPVLRRLFISPDDTVVDVAGPTAVGGYGWQLTPLSTAGANGRRPAYTFIERRPVASGAALTLKFYAAYTGTISDVPECWVELADPNGFTVQQYPFTPVHSPDAALQDIWDDAIADGLKSIAFGGTASADGQVGFRICCVDNAAGDSVLYVGPVTWAQGAIAAADYGLRTYPGEGGLVGEVAAAGGGLLMHPGMAGGAHA